MALPANAERGTIPRFSQPRILPRYYAEDVGNGIFVVFDRAGNTAIDYDFADPIEADAAAAFLEKDEDAAEVA